MTTSILRPNGSQALNVTVTGGGGTAHGATSDNSDASYVTYHDGSQADYTMTTVALPAGAVTKTLTLRVRGGSATGGRGRAVLWGIDTAGVPRWLNSTNFDLSTLATITVVSIPATNPETQGMVQAEIDNLSLTVLKWGVGDIDTHELYLDLIYAAQPTANVTYPTGTPTITDTTGPTATWTHTAGSDGGPQTHYEVKVFTAAQYGAGGFSPDTSASFWSTGIVASSASSRVLGPLDNSTTYRVYVRTAQTINGEAHWSAWDFEQFAISVTTSDIAQVVAIADNDDARIIVDVDPVHNAATEWERLEVERSIDGGTTWVPVRGGTDRTPLVVAYDVPAVDLSGSAGVYLSTPDHATLDITGDVTLVAHVAADDWTPAATQTLVAKWTSSGNQRSYLLRLTTAGALEVLLSQDGTGTFTKTSTANLSTTAAGAWLWVAATVDVVSGANWDVRFWTSVDGVTWTQLGTTVTTAGNISLFAGSAPVTVGAHDVGATGPFAGLIRRAHVRSGIGAAGYLGGTLVADYHANGAGTYTDPLGRVWTVNGAASWVEADVRAGVIVDYEAPNGISTMYRVRATYTEPGGETIVGPWTTSAAVSWSSDDVWVKALYASTLNMAVCPRLFPEWEHPRTVGVFAVIGRADPVTASDVRQDPRGQVVWATETAAEADALRAVMAEPVVLVQWPAIHDEDDAYLAPLGMREQRVQPRVYWTPHRNWIVDMVKIATPADDGSPVL